MKRLLIVGGGIAGLAAAWAIRRADPSVEVTIAERGARLGGKIRTDTVDGFLLEAGPDGFLSRKPALLRLAEELGISDRMIPRSARAVPASVRHANALYPLPEGFSGMVPADLGALSKSDLLSEQGKRRAMSEPSIPAAPARGDESVASFMKRRYGDEAFQLLIEPLISGIYAADADQLSLEATVPHLRFLEQQQGSISVALTKARHASPGAERHPPFLSFQAGMEEIVRALAERLDGVRLLCGCAASSLTPRDGCFRIAFANGTGAVADAVILAVPSRDAAALALPFAPALGRLLGEIPFSSSALIHLAYREQDVTHSLDGYGYLIPAVEGSILLGCTWTSRKWEGRAPAGTVLMRMHAGRYGRPDVNGLPDEELIRLCREEIAATLGIRADPMLTHVNRWELGLPQYNAGHLVRVAEIEHSLADQRGIFLAGSSYRGVGVPDCIESGGAAASRALDFLGKGGMADE